MQSINAAGYSPPPTPPIDPANFQFDPVGVLIQMAQGIQSLENKLNGLAMLVNHDVALLELLSHPDKYKKAQEKLKEIYAQRNGEAQQVTALQTELDQLRASIPNIIKTAVSEAVGVMAQKPVLTPREPAPLVKQEHLSVADPNKPEMDWGEK